MISAIIVQKISFSLRILSNLDLIMHNNSSNSLPLLYSQITTHKISEIFPILTMFPNNLSSNAMFQPNPDL